MSLLTRITNDCNQFRESQLHVTLESSNASYSEAYYMCSMMPKTIPSWFQTELKFLLSNPTCFVVLGKPGAGKTAVARKISQNWHCELVSRKFP